MYKRQALGCAQLETIEQRVLSKRVLAEKYKTWFDDHDIKTFTEPLDSRSNYWLNTIVLDSKAERDEFLAYTNNADIMTRPAWRPMHELSMFANDVQGSLKVTEKMVSRIVNVPSNIIWSIS